MAYPDSVPRKTLDLALAQCVVLASSETLDELAGVLARPKLRRFLPADEALLFFRAFSAKVVPVPITTASDLSRDTDDNAFLNLALSGSADWLIIGDGDLLVLGSIGNTGIVSPAAFLRAMRSAGTSITPRT